MTCPVHAVLSNPGCSQCNPVKPKPMTLKEARKAVKALGYQLEYDRDLDEYSVFTPYAARDTYYTNDREDAVNTAGKMAQRRDARKEQQ